MLNPPEIAKLFELFSGAPDVVSAAAERQFLAQDVVLGSKHSADIVFEETPAPLSKPMRAPDFILGTPFDATCLQGTGVTRFPQKQRKVYSYKKCKIVGWRAILTEAGEFFCGNPITTEAEFNSRTIRARSGFDGFVSGSYDDKPLVFFRKPGNSVNAKGRGIFLGTMEPGNYGSFIFRGLPQILLLAEIRLSIDFIVVGERTAWSMSALNILGFGEIPIFTVREVYGCEFAELLVMDEIDAEAFFDEISLARVRTFVGRCVSQLGLSRPGPGLLYVSRSLSSNRAPTFRVLTNETEIEKMAVSRGFELVYPEVHSLKMQCFLFHQARCIIGPSGSGMLNAAFCPDGTKVADIEIFHFTVRQHAKLYSSTEKSYGFVFGETIAPNPGRYTGGPWKVGADLINQAIDMITR